MVAEVKEQRPQPYAKSTRTPLPKTAREIGGRLCQTPGRQRPQATVPMALRSTAIDPEGLSDPCATLLFCMALLVIQQPFFSPQSATVATQRSICTDNAMTWNHNTKHVASISVAHCAARIRISEHLRHP